MLVRLLRRHVLAHEFPPPELVVARRRELVLEEPRAHPPRRRAADEGVGPEEAADGGVVGEELVGERREPACERQPARGGTTSASRGGGGGESHRGFRVTSPGLATNSYSRHSASSVGYCARPLEDHLEARRRHRAEGAVRVDEAPRPEARVHLLTRRQHVPHDGDRALRHHVRERRVRVRAPPRGRARRAAP